MSDCAAAEASMHRVLCCHGGSECPCGGPSSSPSSPAPSASRSRTPTGEDGSSSEASRGSDFSSGSDSEISSDGPIPHGIPIQDWDGLDSVVIQECEHGCMVVMKKCWGGSNSGRRFLGCPLEDVDEQCDYVHWLDGPWPARVQSAMSAMWREVRVTRRRALRLRVPYGGHPAEGGCHQASREVSRRCRTRKEGGRESVRSSTRISSCTSSTAYWESSHFWWPG